MKNQSIDRLLLGIVLGILLTVTGAYYTQGRELNWLRQHHIEAHLREAQLKTENSFLRQQLQLPPSEQHPICTP